MAPFLYALTLPGRWVKRGRQFLEEKIGWHNEFAAPGDTNLSDATETRFLLLDLAPVTLICDLDPVIL